MSALLAEMIGAVQPLFAQEDDKVGQIAENIGRILFVVFVIALIFYFMKKKNKE